MQDNKNDNNLILTKHGNTERKNDISAKTSLSDMLSPIF